jgi:hypothetical protein
MADGFRAQWGATFDPAEDYAVYLHVQRVHNLVYQLCTKYQMPDDLLAKGFSVRCGSFSLTVALRGLYYNDLHTPLADHLCFINKQESIVQRPSHTLSGSTLSVRF